MLSAQWVTETEIRFQIFWIQNSMGIFTQEEDTHLGS